MLVTLQKFVGLLLVLFSSFSYAHENIHLHTHSYYSYAALALAVVGCVFFSIKKIFRLRSNKPS